MITVVCGEFKEMQLDSNRYYSYGDRLLEFLVCGIDANTNTYDPSARLEKISHICFNNRVYDWCLLKYEHVEYSTGINDYHCHDRLYDVFYAKGSLGCIKLSEDLLLFFNKSLEQNMLNLDWWEKR